MNALSATVLSTAMLVFCLSCGETQYIADTPPPIDIIADTVEDVARTNCVVTDQLTLGSIPVDPQTGLSESFEFDLPGDSLSLLIVVRGASDTLYTLTSLTDPEGNVVVKDNWHQGKNTAVCLACPNRIAAFPGTHAALLPNAPNVTLRPGRWKARYGAFQSLPFTPATDAADVRVFIKRGDELPETGTLKLALFHRLDGPLDGPATEEKRSQLTADLSDVFAQAGVTISHTFNPLPDLPPSGNRAALPALGDTLPLGDDAVPVLMFDELFDGDNAITGFSPVPGGRTEFGGSLVAVQATSPQESKALGHVVAHETGHYLGLWHTRESDGTGIVDPLPDTEIASDDNLMTPDLRGTVLTEMQSTILRRHPLVRHTCPPR